ncbi:hypothetical protein SAMN02746089_00933 [Caldanaerobius fijiensis DSM 17918]|uniref:Lipoprotein n=1 Tax=Caldanaerobius fijiensis DSM 17918 TaxID=1121256 RepID=A0A1M4X2V2_9THEO|nr:hypothetical protein [Caldanaerobius fijiensis]SHE87819.1 hypothetical protein SAMN02746089_00933 [Caldanaerobius fijiensis DSM 17918]
MRKIFGVLLLLTIFLVACAQSKPPVSNNGIFLKEPPELTVIAGNKSIAAVRGTYNWVIYSGNGTRTNIHADSGPPSKLIKFQKEPLNVKPESSIVLDFRIKPNDYKVNIWEGNKPIIQQVNNGIIIAPRQKGLVVYEVQATWNEGDACYAFSVNVD